ncbi:MAG: glutamate racemase [Nannocystaceae bacterium]|nr:aspartate/glutamate racemase family protein [bacterium]
MSPIGVIDWGIGGLDVVRKMRAAGAEQPVLYVSDAGAVPYGLQPDEALARRVGALVRALARRGCAHVLIGCNAASTILDHPAFEGGGARVDGVIRPGIEATLAAGVREVVVLGGRRTVESGRYGAALRPHGLTVREVVAQPLSALVERGVLSGPTLEATLAEILAPVREATAIVSACTHYLAVSGALRAALPRLETLIDPARALVRRHVPVAGPGAQPDRYFTTGDPETSRRAAAAAFGVDAPFERAVGLLDP